MGQLASFFSSRTGAFTFQGSQACIMTSSKHVPEMLKEGSEWNKEKPLWTSSTDEEEIPDLEILPLPMRYHCSLDVSLTMYEGRVGLVLDGADGFPFGSGEQDGKPDGTTPDLMKGKYDKSKGYFTVSLIHPLRSPLRDCSR